MKCSRKSIKRRASEPKPYNHYNLYFILERERFLQERGVPPLAEATGDGPRSRGVDVDVPPFPSRYSSLVLPGDWFVRGRRKRELAKTRGSVSFREMAPMVASRLEREDEEIVRFVETIADNVKKRIDERKGPRQNPIPIPSAAEQEAPLFSGSSMEDQQLQMQISTVRDRIRRMKRFLQDLPTSHGQRGLSCCIQEDHSTRRSSSNSQVDVASDEEIVAIVQTQIATLQDQIRRMKRFSNSQVDVVSDKEIMAMWSSAP